MLAEVVRFLNLPVYRWPSKDLEQFHVGQYEHRMPDETREFLREFYQPHNDQLYALLGHDFGW